MTQDNKGSFLDEPLVHAEDQPPLLLKPTTQYDVLTKIQVYAYGVGHFANDIIAGLMMNYGIYFLVHTEPVNPDPQIAASVVGFVFLTGQFADGLMTPLVGLLSDKFNTRCGKRMPWYYGGVLLATLPTVYMFEACALCHLTGFEPIYNYINYAFISVVQNLGWAMCQVSHMSLVPSLSFSRSRRDMLNNLRGTFTFIAYFFVLAFAAILFATLKNDKTKFEVLSLACIGIGLLASLFFVIQIREVPLTEACRKLRKEYKAKLAEYRQAGSGGATDDDASLKSYEPNPSKDNDTDSLGSFRSLDTIEKAEKKNDDTSLVMPSDDEGASPAAAPKKEKKKQIKFKWYHWFKSLQFWLYGGVYLSSRVYCNIPISLLLLYMSYSLQFSDDQQNDTTPFSFALIPMVIFISSSLVATQLSKYYQFVGRKGVYSIAAIITLVNGVILLFLPANLKFAMYGVAVLLGLTQSSILNSSTAFISEVVGTNEKNGAFVYGFYSLFEKSVNGFILWIILRFKDTSSLGRDQYMRVCISVIPCTAIILGWICIMFGKAGDYKVQGKENNDAIVSARESVKE